MHLADRYHELMGFRSEALKKYRANVMSTLRAPSGRAYLPLVRRSSAAFPPGTGTRVGPITLVNHPPVWRHVIACISEMSGPITVLEIGPGTGDLAAFLRSAFPEKIARYYGLERDKNLTTSRYESVESIEDVREPIDLVIASEVAEHMSADDFYGLMLRPLRPKMTRQAKLVVSVPNPIAPAGISRDFSHLQNYPWYDLYAIFRLEFEDVEIRRTFYVWTLPRLLFLLPRYVLCTLQEMDWCDGLICIAGRARAF